MGGTALEQRVVRAAEAALAEKRYVSAIDVFLGLGWLMPAHLDEWRRGRVRCLERVSPELSAASERLAKRAASAASASSGARRKRSTRPIE